MNNLLCIFSDSNNLSANIKKIERIVSTSIYQYHLETSDDIILTFNSKFKIEKTISIHRKKDVGCFYTLNALNQLIRLINNGVLDKKYLIDWELYRNTFLHIHEGNFTKSPIKFIKKIN